MNLRKSPTLPILLYLVFTCLYLAGPQHTAHAQIPGMSQPQAEQAVPQWPADSLGRRTPRGTVSGFISALADQNYTRASLFLNVKPGHGEGEDLARAFRSLLDQGGQIYPYSWISNESSGREDDNLAPFLDRVGNINVSGVNFDLFVEEIKGPGNAPLWVFSAATVDHVAELATVEGNVAVVERILPDFLKNRTWEGVSIGQWIIMLLLVVLSYLLAWCIIAFFLFIIPKIWKKTAKAPAFGIIKAFAFPVRLYLALYLFLYLSQEAGISIIIRQTFSGFTVIIGMVALLILLWQLTDAISKYTRSKMSASGNASGLSVVLFLRRAAFIAIVVFGLIAVLGAFEVDVTTGLAALGIGGLALALGAQKSIENFVGSVTLITDQPIRIGDFCKVGDTIGTVEKIGMRSTRLRTLDRTVITIPNGEFSSSKIENYAHRDRFRFYTVLGLRYETSPDQIRYLLKEIRAILYAHPIVDPIPARVRFVELGDDSLNLEIFAYVTVTTFDDFLEVKEDLLLRIMDVVAESGSGFAFPSQTLYFAKDEGLSKDKTRTAEEKVQKWRDEEELQIPKFSPEQIEKIRNTIPYPPKGSGKQVDS